MVQNVTSELNGLLDEHAEIEKALRLIASCKLFGRETRSAAVGELSEHLVASFVHGTRCVQGNKGFDVLDGTGQKIEVKSRLAGRWGDGLMFDFGPHSIVAGEAFCLCWDDREATPILGEAYRLSMQELLDIWPNNGKTRYCARTTLGKLRKAGARA